LRENNNVRPTGVEGETLLADAAEVAAGPRIGFEHLGVTFEAGGDCEAGEASAENSGSLSGVIGHSGGSGGVVVMNVSKSLRPSGEPIS